MGRLEKGPTRSATLLFAPPRSALFLLLFFLLSSVQFLAHHFFFCGFTPGAYWLVCNNDHTASRLHARKNDRCLNFHRDIFCPPPLPPPHPLTPLFFIWRLHTRRISLSRVFSQLSSFPHSFSIPLPSIIMSAVTCYKCGEAGHMSRVCPRVAATRSCYNCGETGHLSRDCQSERKPKSCYNCGSTEHLSRECQSEAKDGADTRSCYNCGGTGHLSRDCQSERKPKSCYNCGSTEHLSRECPERH
ncbi:hypothetical protein JKF63_00152 [Porcisia hertigi]|uniref:CCHC-type domain-containing protein n=1 Tax=Porcisia hertigi TaxID=2761500 RepID=A0A836I921_9TRYP|nr:hypothetical protein JKF63_00152 [Porcisia hertigi]